MTEMPIVIGHDATGKNIIIDLAGLAAHVAIQGQTRSGKSNLLYRILGDLAALGAVQICGSDPSGLLLAPFKEPGNNRIVLGTDNMSEHLEMLTELLEIMRQRTEQLLASKADKFSEFTPEAPLIVVVIEEHAGLLEAAEDEDAAAGRTGAKKIEPKNRRTIKQLVAQSAKTGIRVISVTQRADASIYGGAARSNFAVRLTFRVDNPDALRMLHAGADGETFARVERFQPGTFLLDTPDIQRGIARSSRVEYRTYVNRVERCAVDLRALRRVAT